MKLWPETIFVAVFFAISVNAGIRDTFSLVSFQFRYHGITSRFIDVAPKEMCQVIWSLGVSARLGNKLTPTETTGKPSVSWTCDDREKYSLFLMDMDVLGQDNRLMDEGRLWFVANITDCNWYNGETVVDLLPPSPMYGSGEHRFVLLVYRQSNDVYYEEPFVDSTDVEHRYYTSMEKFAIKYGLGEPVCGNFFLSEWDERVDETLKTLKKPYPEYYNRGIAEAELPTQ